MRAFDYLMLAGGVAMLISAAYHARSGKKDVVEMTALTVVGIGIAILGVDKVWADSVPAALEVLASILLVFGGLLFLGMQKERNQS